MLGPDGALAAARPGTIFLEMSTVARAPPGDCTTSPFSRGGAVLDVRLGSTPQRSRAAVISWPVRRRYTAGARRFSLCSARSRLHGASRLRHRDQALREQLAGSGVQAWPRPSRSASKRAANASDSCRCWGTPRCSHQPVSSWRKLARTSIQPRFARLMFKDFSLVAQRAMELSVAIAAHGRRRAVSGVEHAQQSSARADEDFSAVIRTMQQMAGWLSGRRSERCGVMTALSRGEARPGTQAAPAASDIPAPKKTTGQRVAPPGRGPLVWTGLS